MVSKTALLALGLLAFVAVAHCEPLEGETRDLLGRKKPKVHVAKRKTKNKVYQKNRSYNRNKSGVVYNPQKNAAINGDHSYIEQTDKPTIINKSHNRLYIGRLLLGRKKPTISIKKRKTKNKVYQKNRSYNKNDKGVIYNTQKNGVVNGDHSYVGQNDRPHIANGSGNVIFGRLLLGRKKPKISIKKRRTKNKVYQKNRSYNKNDKGVIYNTQKNAAINGDYGYIEQNDKPHIVNGSGNRIYGRLLLGRKKPKISIKKRKTKNKVYQKNRSYNKNDKGVIYNPQKNAAINGDYGYIEQNDKPYISNGSGNLIIG